MNQLQLVTKIQHRKFKEEEDKHLIELIQTYGTSDWVFIATMMRGRSSRQCRERWLNYLTPDLNKNEFTQDEDDLIFSKYSEFGPKWTVISKCFMGRTDQMIKNRFFILQRKINNNNQPKIENKAKPKRRARLLLPFEILSQHNNISNSSPETSSISSPNSSESSPINIPIENDRLQNHDDQNYDDFDFDNAFQFSDEEWPQNDDFFDFFENMVEKDNNIFGVC